MKTLFHVLDNRITDHELKDFEMPISQMQGIHSSLADLPNSVQLHTVPHYEGYLARLHQIRELLPAYRRFAYSSRKATLPYCCPAIRLNSLAD